MADKAPYAARGRLIGTGWPSMRYNAAGESMICNSAADVPEGWADSVANAKKLAEEKSAEPQQPGAEPQQPGAEAPEAPEAPAPEAPAQARMTRRELVAALSDMGVTINPASPLRMLADLYQTALARRQAGAVE